MNKCWFVLEQSFFTPPQYATLSKAGGKAEGDLRLGDVVPSPKDLYPILTKGPLPLFGPDMRISSSQFCDFSWDTTKEREGDATVGGGAPIATAVGATVNAEVKAEFKRTMKNWVNYETMDIEIVQPSTAYIKAVLNKEDVKNHIDQKKIPLLDRWTVYVVTGLMIGRAQGTVGNSTSSSTGFGGGPEVDVPGVASAKLNASIKNSNETSKSVQVQGDRIWAVRFAKVHKGLLRPRWMQTEETVGAALDGKGQGDELVEEVLQHEEITDFEIAQLSTDRHGQMFFVTGGREIGNKVDLCLEVPDLNEDDWIEQKSAEFNWWTSGLNADKDGPGSLDSRLRLRPDVRDAVADLLEGLMTALSKCDELDRTPSPWSDMGDSTGSPARSPAEGVEDKAAGDLYQEPKFYIETNLEILIRIHAAIKKSGLKFRNKRADDDLMRAEERYQLEKTRLGEHTALYGSDTSIGEHERFRLFLTRRVLQNGYKEGLLRHIDGNIQRFITAHGPESEDHPYIISQRRILLIFRAYLYDPARLTTIQRRLINANVVRRNRLIHAGGAEKAQSRTRQDDPKLPLKLPTVKEVAQPSQVEDQTSDHLEPISAAQPSQSPSLPKPKSRKSFVSQAATGLASNFSITDALSPTRKTKSAATKMSARVANIDYPKCPANQGPFPCPYCPSILSHAYTKRTKWRAHVAQDLCAYVCIFEDCEYADDMYASTYEWMSHMAKHHSVMEWTCTECSKHNMMTDSFDDPVQLKEHILALHPDVEPSEMDLLVNAGKRPAGIQRVACPLCRPGLVTSGEEDEDLVQPVDCVGDIGLVQLEEDEHVATHIHEFSLQAFPWPGKTNTEDKSGMSLSHSTASSRQEIIFQSSGDTDHLSERADDFYNADEFLEIMQGIKVEFGSQKLWVRLRYGDLSFIMDQFLSNIERMDAEMFFPVLNECRITASLLQDITLYPADGFEHEISRLNSEANGHLQQLVSLLKNLREDATQPATPSSYLISSLASSRGNSISYNPRDPDEVAAAEDPSLRNQGDNGYDGDDPSQSLVPDAEVHITWDELGEYRQASEGEDAVLRDMIKSQTMHSYRANDDGHLSRFVAVGIDFGTTYSGVCWARSTNPKEANPICGWPSENYRNLNEVKVPTLYDIDSGKWGYEITTEMEPMKWFKLLLLNSEDITKEEIRNAPQLQQARHILSKSKGTTVVQVVGFYLRNVWDHTYAVLRSMLDIDNLPLRVAITIPAIWPPYAQNAMREAAKIAGIMKYRDIGETTLTLVQEPEAAALATLFQQNDSPEIQKNESFVVCDAGGGTVDVISYEVISERPFRVRECVPGAGKLAGAFLIDQAFESYLHGKAKLKISSLKDYEYNKFILREWELGAKRSFSITNAKENYHLHPPSKAFGTFARLRNKDTLTISKSQKVLLVGGLGSSEYVYDVLTEIYSNKVLRPIDGWSAVARGAVIRLLQDSISAQPIHSPGHHSEKIEKNSRLPFFYSHYYHP
ncbi:hypothetical protein F53441_14029 [Fusarium austroafricanum]|uniref:Uncharacterized protein n=1 Tax=Fusarium austroafricanum TaxID=2364996 RepID=A0A8H4JJ41_9HYPO|nr:hypothetical protein F53441_14029 [Fusarium austroafricanum]